MMLKRSLGIISALVLVVGACGGNSSGSSTERYQGCSKEGEKVKGKDGLPLACVMNSAGELMWEIDGDAPVTGDFAQSLSSVFGDECDPDGPKTYSAGIGDASQMSYIDPLGAMITTHITPIDHIYVYYPQGSENSAPGTFMLTAPADGTIVSVEDFRKNNDYPYPDYRVVISHSCDLYSVFIHVGELQGVAAEAASAAAASGYWKGSIPVSTGEVIADDSLTPGFDFSTFATAAKTEMVNPGSYMTMESWKPFTANPFDYFPAEVTAAYEAKTVRAKAPVGGTIFHDIDGSAQGVWFVKDTNGYRGKGDQKASYNNHGKVARGYWDTHLAFAPHHVDASTFIYSIGDWEGCPCQFMSVGNLDPSAVTVGAQPTVVDLVEYGYLAPDGSMMDPNKPVKGYSLTPGDTVVGSVAFQINADGSMTVEKRPGKDAASFTGFGAGAQTYVR
jgi:hypothetical protein